MESFQLDVFQAEEKMRSSSPPMHFCHPKMGPAHFCHPETKVFHISQGPCPGDLSSWFHKVQMS